MTTVGGPDCASLESLTDFDDYVRRVRRETQFEDALLEKCRVTICSAIWGDNNPDISGIGVSIGYAIEMGLGLLLAIFVLTIRQRKGPRWEFCQLMAQAGFDAFFQSAVYFAISLEIASIYMLVHKDYGISTDGLGASEAQIILAVSVVCVLPVLYPVALLPTRLFQANFEVDKKPPGGPPKKTTEPRNVRFTLFSLLAVLFFYPFLSQCIHNWAPSRVGEGNGPAGETLATHDEWAKVGEMCFREVEVLSYNELWVLAIFEIIASIVIFLFAIWLLIGAGARTLLAQDRAFGEERRLTVALLKIQGIEGLWKRNLWVQVAMLPVPAILAGPLLWCIFRLRGMHSVALKGLELEYTGNEWGFGQVVGIIMFAPVVIDMGFAAWAARSLLTVGGQIV
ncbi:hypothetical protein CMUS01_09024 [Colletotrichum musicola]|uniref:Uncharacterized protein n=1 Tax=Colletotrichum musicola TaxID=2175873 RepID=A0A8H6NBH2_9PEZI|nr:hypothetical protein CMUS01_09024 [Colletotrichum musicola]